MLAMGEHGADKRFMWFGLLEHNTLCPRGEWELYCSVLFKCWLGSLLPWVQPEHCNVCRSILWLKATTVTL
jgi:hypothetical protein